MKRRTTCYIHFCFPALFVLLLAAFPALAQNKTVTGKVTDAKDNRALEAVTVIVKDSKLATQTRSDGSFSINVPANTKYLNFSAIGYETQQVQLGASLTLAIAMVQTEKSIEDVVVIGYGVTRKTHVTSAITSVKEKDFNKGAVMSPMSLVQGKVPGLVIVNSNGTDPNGQSSMELRGVSTLKGSTSPFVVIDGVPGGNLNNLSPEDVESIDVLRDGSAAAIYGTRGSNGVIIVTTKRAKSGTASFNYDSYVYTDIPKKFPAVLTAEQYRAYADVYKRTNPTFVLNDAGASTDWFKVLSKTPVSQVHNFSVSSGTDKSTIPA